MPTEENINWIFDHTRELQKTGEIDWSIDDVCSWSFIFADPSEEKLVTAAEHLYENGYDVQGLFAAEESEDEEDADDPEMIFLQIDQVQIHTAESLLAETEKLKQLVEPFNLAEFDGIEVGPEEWDEEEEVDDELEEDAGGTE